MEEIITMSHYFKLKDIIDLHMLQSMQDEFAIATDLAIITVDYKGTPITSHSKCSKFCKLIRNNPELKGLCEQSDAHGGLEAVRKQSPYIYRCHLGLVDFAAPIMFDNQYLGSILGGQVLIEEEKLSKLDLILNTSTDLDEDIELLDAYSKLPIIPLEKVKAISETLSIFCNYLVEKTITNISQKELHRKNMELIESKQKQMELESLINKMELKTLQSQINPHFLFNALNTLGRLALLEDASKTQDLVYMLANMLRFSLKQNNEKIYLEDEINYVENYLTFQKVRFGDRINFNIKISEEIKNIKLPFMSIQPIVENCIVHGLEPKESGGLVKIEGYKYKNDAIIDIIDNGIGIKKDKINSIINNENSDSLGINNVNKRLIHYYGASYCLKLISNINTGTSVTLKIPIKES
jgi:ligand-binding sensor protein